MVSHGGKGADGFGEMFRLNARRRRCSKSMARARSSKRGSRRRQRNERDAKIGSLLEAGRGVTVGLDQPRWLTHHASCWSRA